MIDDKDPHWQQPAIVTLDEKRPGIELLHLQGHPGYQDEHLHIENGLGNGLRFLSFEVDEETGEQSEYCHFHITARSTARLIARTLLEWSERIANPPKVPK